MDDFISVLLSIVDNLPGKRDRHPVASQSLAPYQMSPWVAVLLLAITPSIQVRQSSSFDLVVGVGVQHWFFGGRAA